MADPLSIFSFQLPSGVGRALLITGAILLALAPIVFFIWKKKTYKHIVYIKEVRNGTPFNRSDVYRYKIINNTECIKLWRSKSVLERPPQDYVRRIADRDVIEYIRLEDGHFYPRKIVEVNSDTIGYKISNRDGDYWASMRTRMAIIKWSGKSFMEMYGAPLSVLFVAVIFILGMYIFWGGMRDTVNPIVSVATQLSQTNTLLAQILNGTMNNSVGTIVVS